ncbi:MAG: hypothetical protein Ct9H300mP11_23200 [Chloroflexota bacterium]|nr:MAG: hypothetical protein Ct9H300mP11_23200 [Chloroflexota bacterium]
MAQQLSGQRYAQAIFDLALENNEVEQWGQDLGWYQRLFKTPILPP